MIEDDSMWALPDPGAPEEVVAVRAPDARSRRLTQVLGVSTALLLVLGVFGALTTRGGKGETDRVTSEQHVDGPDAAVALAAAPAASRAAGSAHVRTSMRSAEDGVLVKESVEGAISFTSSAFDLTYTYDEAGAPQAMFGMSNEPERVFSDGTTVWSAIPPYMFDMPSAPASRGKVKNPFKGKKYVAYPVDGSGGDPLLSMSVQSGLGFSIGEAPGDVLNYLTGVGTAVQQGTEQLDGEDVTRYAVELDLDALQRALPSEQRSFDAYDFKPDVPHTFPATVWLDRSGRLRRLTYSLDLSKLLTQVALGADYVVEECPDPDPALVQKAIAGDRKAADALDALDLPCTERPARPEELLIEGSVEISGYGVPLNVVAPPDAEVITEADIEKAMTQSARDTVSLVP
jgi:hypothetical protein